MRKVAFALISAIALALMASCGGGGGGSGNSASAPPPSTPSANARNIGINIGTAVDWDTSRMFADAMKSSRAWQDPNNNSAELTGAGLDAYGWPTKDAAIIVWQGIPNMQGSYALSFTGKATVQTHWGDAPLSNQTYDPNTNKTTAKIDYRSTDGSGLLLTFTTTQQTASSATNTGISNVVLMRPKAVGGTESYTTDVFTAPFLAALAPFSVLRSMDYAGTNQSNSANWSDRTRPGHASQQRGNPAVSGGGYQGRGGAWEYMVLLANQASKDLWINVPEEANDDYITKLAQLMKYGSDGTTPYTSAQTSPVWPGLAAGRKLYVEFSNEVWNTGFAQAGANHTSAQAEVAAGGSPLNFDGSSNDWNWAWRRTAKRTVDISNIFRSVWGDAAMMTQVRPVLMSQLGYADGPLYQAMHLMMDYYANPAQLGAAAHLPNYFIYGAGGSAYYSPSDKTSVDAIFASMNASFETNLQKDANWALPFGLKRIAYEGGPSLDSTGDATKDANQAAAWADPRMRQVITNQQAIWDRNGGELLMYFTLAGGYQWGFMNDVLSPTSPKMSGIADINASAPTAPTYGTALPASITASQAVNPPAWTRPGTTLNQYAWLSYPVLVASAGKFNIALTASTASSAQAEIIVDGVSLGTVAVPASAASPALVTSSLAAGSHGIIIRSAAGSFNLSQIQVQAN